MTLTLTDDGLNSGTTTLNLGQKLFFNSAAGNVFAFETNTETVTMNISGPSFDLSAGDGVNFSNSEILPNTPTITSPGPNSVFGEDTIILSGTANPNTTVKVDLIDGFGDVVATQNITSNTSGNWSATFDSSSLVDGFYTALSLAVSGNSNESRAAEVTFDLDRTPCLAPDSGNWTVETNCTLESNEIAPQNFVVEGNSVLTIPSGTSLDIDFSQSNITIESGGSIVIKSGGNIQ